MLQDALEKAKRQASSLFPMGTSFQSTLASTSWSGLHFIRPHRVQHNLVGSLLSVGRITLAPIVANRVSKDIAIAAERSARDRAANGRVALESVLSIFIPEVERAVTTGSTESSVYGVEVDRVDGVDIADITIGLTVALEGEVGSRVLLLDVLNSAAALNTTDREAGSISEATDYPCLILEGGLHSLVEFGRVVEINDIDVAVRGTDNKQLVLDIHCVNAILAINLRNGVRLSQIPVFDRLIPGSRHEKRRPADCRVGNHVAASNWRIVRGNLYGGRCSSA